MIESTAAAPVTESRWQAVLRRWPSVLGLAAAGVQVATGADRDTVTIVLCVAVLCYLGAAALGRPWVAWAAVAGGSVVVAASEVLGLPFWVGIGVVSAVLVVAGVLGRVSRPALTAQTVALVAFGGVGVAALYFAPRLGLAVAGVALAGHAVWDFVHYRRNKVVPRSLSEFCMLLDLPLGTAAVLLAIID